MKKAFFIAGGALFLLCCCGCTATTAGIPAVEYFDAASYAGIWYEIARLPNWFERGMTGVRACYTLNPDGTLKVVNSGFRGGKLKTVTGKAWFTVRRDVGMLRVQFFFPFSGVYKIIYLDREYSVAVVTGSDYSYLWILARTPQISDELLVKLVQWVTALGYESENLIFPNSAPGNHSGKAEKKKSVE